MSNQDWSQEEAEALEEYLEELSVEELIEFQVACARPWGFEPLPGESHQMFLDRFREFIFRPVQ